MDREVLAAALEEFRKWGAQHISKASDLIDRAVSERLAQLPEKCQYCQGSKFIRDAETDDIVGCGYCDERGTVYPAALVERIAETMKNAWRIDYRSMAVEVLDALNDWNPE